MEHSIPSYLAMEIICLFGFRKSMWLHHAVAAIAITTNDDFERFTALVSALAMLMLESLPHLYDWFLSPSPKTGKRTLTIVTDYLSHARIRRCCS
jgi:hypothetical protein